MDLEGLGVSELSYAGRAAIASVGPGKATIRRIAKSFAAFAFYSKPFHPWQAGLLGILNG